MSMISNTSEVLSQPLTEWLRELQLTQYINQQQIESGRLVGQIMKKTIDGYKLELLNSNSAVNRVSNWNNLITQLKSANIRVTQDEKTKIVNGNMQLVYQIINKLRDNYVRNQKSNEVDISKISAKNQIAESASLLELLILAIMRHFNLNAKQSVALLSNDSKYLAHILAKGLKSEFKPIEGFLSQLDRYLDLVCGFCTKNRQNQIFFIRALKPALISKSDVVSLRGLQLFDKYLTNTCETQDKIAHKNDIITHHLLSTLLLATRRHPHLLNSILKFLLQQTAYNNNILNILKSQLPDSPGRQAEFQNMVAAILRICQQSGHLDQFFNFKGLKQIVDKLVSNIRNIDTVLSSMHLLIELITQNSSIIGEYADISSLIGNIQQISSNFSKNIQEITFVNQLFSILSIQGQAKNPIAPSIYKLLLSKYNDTINTELSQAFIQNFSDIVRQFPTIPFSLIVQSINNKVQSNKQSRLTQKELQFFMLVLYHQEIQQKTALIIYNAVSKLLIQEAAYSEKCGEIMLIILRKFGKKEMIFYDMTGKFVKVCLAVHFANVKKMSMHKKKSVTGATKTDPQDVVTKSKNVALQEFMFKLVTERIQQINSSSEPLICYSLIQVQNLGKEYGIGLRKVVSGLGNPENIIKKYQQQVKKLDEQNAKKQQNVAKKSKLKQSWAPNNASRYSKSPDMTSQNHMNSEDNMLPTKKLSTGSKMSKYDHTIFQSSLGVTPAAQRGLQKYHKVYLSKIQKLQKQQTKKKQDQQRQQYLKRVFERKMLDKGIQVKKLKEQDYQYIYEFGVKEKQISQDTVKGRIQLPYYEPQNQQDRDIKGLQYTTKRYQRILKLYYSIYSGHVRAKNLDSFDQIAQKHNLLYSAGLVKLFKEHTLDEFLSVRQLQYLTKKVNTKLGKKFDDATSLDYEGFEQFMIQASFVMFTRPPKDLSGHPLSEMVQETIGRLKLYANQNKINQQLFDDPDNVYFNETQAVRQLNRKLADNSEYILPEGYKKIVEKKVIFTHRIFLDAMSPAYKDVYEVINQILQKGLDINIIEPFTTYETFARARPALYFKQRQEGEVNSEKLSIFMKRQVAKIPIKDRQIAKHAAGVLQDIIEAVELGHDRIGIKHENKLLRGRKLEQQQMKKRRQQEKKKWEDRNRHIKSALVKHKQAETQKQKQQKQKKKQQKRKQQQLKKKRQDQQRRLKKKVQEYQQKKKQDEQRRKIQDRERRKKQKEEAERKKKQSQQVKKMIQQTKQRKQEQQAQRKKKQQEQNRRIRIQQKKKYQQQQKRKKQMIEQYKNSKSMVKSGINQSKLSKA